MPFGYTIPFYYENLLNLYMHSVSLLQQFLDVYIITSEL